MHMPLTYWSIAHDWKVEVLLPVRTGHCHKSANSFGLKVNKSYMASSNRFSVNALLPSALSSSAIVSISDLIDIRLV